MSATASMPAAQTLNQKTNNFFGIINILLETQSATKHYNGQLEEGDSCAFLNGTQGKCVKLLQGKVPKCPQLISYPICGKDYVLIVEHDYQLFFG